MRLSVQQILTMFFLCCGIAEAQSVRLTASVLELVNVQAEDLSWQGKDAVRLTEAGEGSESVALVKGTSFTNGILEVEVAGRPLPSANAGARGFIGLAFRVRKGDTLRYECFYLRPTNGRAEDQLRRNHSTQYVSHPGFPWYRLREEEPGKYESYVDLVPGEWTNVKIMVEGTQARLFVHGSAQPCLIVNDLKGGLTSGGVALWVGNGTEGYFRNLTIKSAS